MNNVEYLSAVKLNSTNQFSSTSDQSMLHVVQCVCKWALALTENTLQQNIISSKCPSHFWSLMSQVVAVWRIFVCNMSQFTIFCSHMIYSVLHTLKTCQKWYLVSWDRPVHDHRRRRDRATDSRPSLNHFHTHTHTHR